jgi:hypothetical protein
MRLGRDDAPDGVKSVLSGVPWPLAAVMRVTLRSCSVPAKRDGQHPVPSLTPLGPAKTLANPKLQALYMDQVSTRNESLPNPVALDLC